MKIFPVREKNFYSLMLLVAPFLGALILYLLLDFSKEYLGATMIEMPRGGFWRGFFIWPGYFTIGTSEPNPHFLYWPIALCLAVIIRFCSHQMRIALIILLPLMPQILPLIGGRLMASPSMWDIRWYRLQQSYEAGAIYELLGVAFGYALFFFLVLFTAKFFHLVASSSSQNPRD